MVKTKANLLMESKHIYSVFKTIFIVDRASLSFLSKQLNREKTTITTQLATLNKAQLIDKVYNNRERVYTINREKLAELILGTSIYSSKSWEQLKDAIFISTNLRELKENTKKPGKLITTAGILLKAFELSAKEPQDYEIENLKKRITELEKQIESFKQKK